LLRTIHRLRELADLPLETKSVALQLERYRIAVGERMLQLGEDRDRGVGFLLQEQPNAIEERGEVSAHRHA
jgi:hypothetical protein